VRFVICRCNTMRIKPIKFMASTAATAPNGPGVYIIWSLTAIGRLKPIYVGMSKTSVRTRLAKHFSKSHNKGVDMYVRGSRHAMMVCWGTIPADRAKALETKLIRMLSPLENIVENK
jgi:excinuclease UvrABC nuclease subunit